MTLFKDTDVYWGVPLTWLGVHWVEFGRVQPIAAALHSRSNPFGFESKTRPGLAKGLALGRKVKIPIVF